ncbi:MAG: DUF3800 domain-containing protein [bacterium]
MFYLFLDESGDLGFDFDKVGTTRHFVVTVLLLTSTVAMRAMERAVERTIKTKISRNRADRSGLELKGAKTDLKVKQYFFQQCANVDFEICTVILDKSILSGPLTERKSPLYNFLARQAVEEVPWPQAQTRILISIDKSQAPHEIQALNRSLVAQLQGKISPNLPLEIFHMISHDSRCLQAADLFSWGIFRKHEVNDSEWYDLYAGKIRSEVKFSSTK